MRAACKSTDEPRHERKSIVSLISVHTDPSRLAVTLERVVGIESSASPVSQRVVELHCYVQSLLMCFADLRIGRRVPSESSTHIRSYLLSRPRGRNEFECSQLGEG